MNILKTTVRIIIISAMTIFIFVELTIGFYLDIPLDHKYPGWDLPSAIVNQITIISMLIFASINSFGKTFSRFFARSTRLTKAKTLSNLSIFLMVFNLILYLTWVVINAFVLQYYTPQSIFDSNGSVWMDVLPYILIFVFLFTPYTIISILVNWKL